MSPHIVKKIPRYPNYTANSNGEIFTVDQQEVPKFLGKAGYYGVWLRQGKRKPKFTLVHKIMGITFLGGRPSKNHVLRHLDGNCHNNKLSNLKWGTYKENAADRKKHALEYNILTTKDKTLIKKKLDAGYDPVELAGTYNVSFLTINGIKWKDATAGRKTKKTR